MKRNEPPPTDVYVPRVPAVELKKTDRSRPNLKATTANENRKLSPMKIRPNASRFEVSRKRLVRFTSKSVDRRGWCSVSFRSGESHRFVPSITLQRRCTRRNDTGSIRGPRRWTVQSRCHRVSRIRRLFHHPFVRQNIVRGLSVSVQKRTARRVRVRVSFFPWKTENREKRWTRTRNGIGGEFTEVGGAMESRSRIEGTFDERRVREN